jgi:hypothetical protein
MLSFFLHFYKQLCIISVAVQLNKEAYYQMSIHSFFSVSLFHRAFKFTIYNGPTNTLVCNKILIQMSHSKTHFNQ